ncbi:macrophage mannose receptor 1-like, partial [Astyanax mexicanus]|uniref:C-type lectin domain-containing protein n=2 Tax=Astyanax mexicanus TaxID=7994 RepID=W5K609_ASTMX
LQVWYLHLKAVSCGCEPQHTAFIKYLVLTGICRSACSANQYHFISKGRSYSEAQQYCRSTHTDLATINSEADMQNLLATVSGGYSGAAWIGLYRQSTPLWHWSLPDHQYYTHGGTQYRNWQPGEPNNSGGSENCGSMGDNGKFSDTPCTVKKPFICFNCEFLEP